MKKKKGQLKKDKKFYFCLFIISIALIGSIAFITSNKVLKVNKNETTIEDQPKLSALDIQECPYTLDEIYNIIQTNELWEHRFDEEGIKMGYVLTHFYDYFNKDTKFMAAKEFNDYPVSFKYVTYEEYQKAMIDLNEPWEIIPVAVHKEKDYYYAAIDLISYSFLEKMNGKDFGIVN